MATIQCSSCGATTQTDSALTNCPSCQAAIAPGDFAAAPVQSVAGDAKPESAADLAALGVETANTQKHANVVEVPAPAPAAAAPAPAPADPPPAAPVSAGTKIAEGIEIGLADTAAVAKLIGDNFAGTPIAAIFKLLGPAAGIGAAVLAQHLENRGFDLAKLQPVEIL